MMKALVAEFIGTFALIFIGVGAIAANHLVNGSAGLTGIALAHGLTIAVMVTATAAISGGHLNPAVSIGLLVGRQISAQQAVAYVIAQCLGAIVAAIVLKLAIPGAALDATGWGVPAVGSGATVLQAFIVEIVLTFFLVFVVCGTAVDSRAPRMGGLFIGLTVALDILAGGPITGGAMNPARHLGPALVSGQLSQVWLYWGAPLAGGMLASAVYFSFLSDGAKK